MTTLILTNNLGTYLFHLANGEKKLMKSEICQELL